MADSSSIVIGPRSDGDVAFELMKWVFGYMDNKPQTKDELLALYHRCRYEVVNTLNDLRANR